MAIEIQEKTPLAPFTTMHVGGEARFFVSVENVDQLRESIVWAHEKKVPFFILGGGSNTIVSDEGFPGLVIKIEINGVYYEAKGRGVVATVGAGEIWDDFVDDAVARNLWGIENLSLIPGTVGGATVQNIGAYGAEVSEAIVSVEAFDVEKMQTRIFLQEQCGFGYRESIFKKNKSLVVLHTTFGLVQNGQAKINYDDVRKYFDQKKINASKLQNIREAIISIRKEKMPGQGVGTAGSFFKNPVVSMDMYEMLKRRYPEIKANMQGDNTVKLSAAWLLDKVGGFRGLRQGDAGVWNMQALILVNYGSAGAHEIILLADKMKKSIKEKTNVQLENEVVVL